METLIKKDTRQLRSELRDGNSEAFKSRRVIIALSFIEAKKAWRVLTGN